VGLAVETGEGKGLETVEIIFAGKVAELSGGDTAVEDDGIGVIAGAGKEPVQPIKTIATATQADTVIALNKDRPVRWLFKHSP
jgi:hypothetical protein